jgi:hypothetical protein
MARLIDADAALEAVCYNCMDKYDCPDRCSDYMEVFDIPTVDAVEVVHGRWEKSKRHLWYKDDGEIDEFRYTSGFHNGPVCMVCGSYFCIHCEPNYDETECYDHHYICSKCGEPSLDGQSNYCPNCGAKMDGDGNGC